MLTSKVLCFGLLCAISATAQDGPVVQTAQGLLRGVAGTDGDYNLFMGIPYGTVDETNRFKEALPPPTWDGIRDANDDSKQCPQLLTAVSEDCLVLNVYAPKNVSANSMLSVMVYIHGGNFVGGDSSRSQKGPQFLIRHDIVLVTINYRLGLFGFLCLGTEEIPGNAGLKDTVHALRWVRDNIIAFGGDSRSVTIFGNSAGSVAVEYLVLSPMAAGLFHKAISQSGSVLAPVAVQREPMHIAVQIAELLGSLTTDINELQQLFQNTDTSALLAAANHFIGKIVPCVENSFDGIESFITTDPYSIMTSGNFTRIPFMTGYTNKEGLYYIPEIVTTNKFQNIQENFKDELPVDLFFPNEEAKRSVAERVYNFYFGEDDLSLSKAEEVVDYMSDIIFLTPANRAVRLHAEKNDQPVYFYELRYEGELNFIRNSLNINSLVNISGACHADEYGYLFVVGGTIPNANADDQLMIDRMTLLWTNFAKYGNPTPEANNIIPLIWSPVTTDSLNYLILDKTLVLDQNPIRERVSFWDDLYSQYFIDIYVANESNVPRQQLFIVLAAGFSVLLVYNYS